ncbi:hypothetical protein ACFOY2_51270 [Nonomuraea purpurea]|uniref:Uncharacterized protein n=1 Tax=Nonomuraea purpurea TaxID=1849276 RepID=A0ABV8GTM4_9ACTN
MAVATARAILFTLKVRGIPIPDETYARILECGNLFILRPRLEKAFTVNSAEELFE